MTREEWAAWAKSLKPGDSVIVNKWGSVYLDTVKRITPAGWVVTENNGTYSQSTCYEFYRQRGGYHIIKPVTEELEKKALEEMAEAERRRKIQNTIRDARSVVYNWFCSRDAIDYNLALKILALAGMEVTDHEV